MIQNPAKGGHFPLAPKKSRFAPPDRYLALVRHGNKPTCRHIFGGDCTLEHLNADLHP
jgi:hypothetical protein